MSGARLYAGCDHKLNLKVGGVPLVSWGRGGRGYATMAYNHRQNPQARLVYHLSGGSGWGYADMVCDHRLNLQVGIPLVRWRGGGIL